MMWLRGRGSLLICKGVADFHARTTAWHYGEVVARFVELCREMGPDIACNNCHGI